MKQSKKIYKKHKVKTEEVQLYLAMDDMTSYPEILGALKETKTNK
jgi:hypothetical protein